MSQSYQSFTDFKICDNIKMYIRKMYTKLAKSLLVK